MEKKQYDVFISYSRKDYVDGQQNVIPGNVVSQIKELLTAEGISYWFDEEGIYSGQNFVEKIVTNIEASDIFVYLSTANANKSPWTAKEIATAEELHKHIIPVRIDDTPYNRKVLFRIADLDYIEYYVNPEKGRADLVDAIKKYLRQKHEAEELRKQEEARKAEAERRRQEEERLRKEQEEKRQREEQHRLVKEIKLACTALNNEEAKIEIDRNNLLLKTERVTDAAQREELVTLIASGGPIRKKCKEEALEVHEKLSEQQALLEKLTEENQRLAGQLKERDDALAVQTEQNRLAEENRKKLSSLTQQLEAKEKEREFIYEKNAELQNELANRGNKPQGNKMWHVFYGGIIALLVLLLVAAALDKRSGTVTSRTTVKEDTVVLAPTESSKDSTASETTKNVENMTYNHPALNSYSYTGPLNADGKPEGKGKAIFWNGDVFEGTFQDGNLLKGHYRWVDGAYFDGSFNEKGKIVEGVFVDKLGNQKTMSNK